MSYKIQLGQFHADGALTVDGDVKATSNQANKGALTGSTVTGTNGLTGNYLIAGKALEISSSNGTHILLGAKAKIADTGGNYGYLELLNTDGNSSNSMVWAGADSTNSGHGLVKVMADGGAIRAKMEGATGQLSGSGTFQSQGLVTTTGNVTIVGNLTANATVTLNVSNARTTDTLVKLDNDAGDKAESLGSGLLFGQENNQNGATFLYQEVGGLRQFQARDARNSGNAPIDISGSVLYGAATGLTGVDCSDMRLNVTKLTNNGQAGKGITIWDGNLSGNQTITLHKDAGGATGPVVAGSFRRIKLAGTAGANKLTINTQGGEQIDGVNEITLDSDYASVDLMWDGSHWMIV